MMSGDVRTDPFEELDIDEFKPAPKKDEAEVDRNALIDGAARIGFVSRQPTVPEERVQNAPATRPVMQMPMRRARRRTDRVMQINFRVRPETVELINNISDQEGWILAEVLEKALEALEEKRRGGG